jgi:hypothetical protein
VADRQEGKGEEQLDRKQERKMRKHEEEEEEGNKRGERG